MCIKKIFQNHYFRNIRILIGGSGLANLIPLVASPFIMRFYQPEDYGQFAYFVSCISVLAIFCNGRYPQAILLPKSNKTSAALVAASVGLSVITACVVVIFLSVSRVFPGSVLSLTSLGSSWIFLPIGIICYSFFETITAWLNRKQNYSVMAGMRILKSSVTESFNLILGSIGMGNSGLVIAFLSGYFAAVVLGTRKDSTVFVLFATSRTRLLATLRKYKSYPLFNMPASLADTFSLQAAVFFLSHYFSMELVGLFGFSQRIIAMPAALMGQAVSQVYYRELSSSQNSGKSLVPVYRKTAVLLVAVALPVSLGLVLLAETIFTIVFGENWALAGMYAAILAPAFFVRFVVSPLSPVFFVTNRLKVLACWKWLYFFTTVTVLYFGCLLLEFKHIIYLYSAHEVLLYGIYFGLQLYVLRSN